MAEEGVVVEDDFGVESEKSAVARDDERIDFGEGGVDLFVDLGEIEHELGGFGDVLVLEAELEGEFAGLEGLKAEERVHGLLENFVGGFSGDFLDFDAAFGGGDHGYRGAGAVPGDSKIIFVSDLNGWSDEEDGDGHALRAGLIADHSIGEHEFGGGGGFAGGFDEFDEAGFSAAAGVDLRFDHADGRLQLLEGDFGLLGGSDNF